MARQGRRKFLRSVLLGSAATTSLSPLLKACTPDFAEMDAASSAADQDGSAQDAATGARAGTKTAESKGAEIKVGLLHSLSGPMALSETSLVEAELLAIEEINAKGGLLGKKLVPIKEDGASDWPTFAEKAEKLIDFQGVSVIFGGLSTPSRKAILPVVSAKNCLLWYPGAYKGRECSAHIFYAGPTANQQIQPAVDWMLGNRGKSFFLLSANDRDLHEMLKEQIRDKGGKVAGEAYLSASQGTLPDLAPVIKDIKQALPEGGLIFNALLGSDNRSFFKELKSAGLSSSRYLVLSTHVSEEEVFEIGPQFLQGHYAAWPYFQSIDSPANQEWVERFQKKYGARRVVSAPMNAAYSMVHLWAKAVTQSGSTATEAVRQAAYGQTFSAPSGQLRIETNHHFSQPFRLGRVQSNGQFEILASKQAAIAPNPWSQYLPEDKGFTCDWSDPDRGEKYRKPTPADLSSTPASPAASQNPPPASPQPAAKP